MLSEYNSSVMPSDVEGYVQYKLVTHVFWHSLNCYNKTYDFSIRVSGLQFISRAYRNLQFCNDMQISYEKIFKHALIKKSIWKKYFTTKIFNTIFFNKNKAN